MAEFVLVHGGWHGGWCWKYVEPILRAAGHEVAAPTMTGMGDRSHLVDAVEGPDTHVTDVVNTIRWAEMSDVTLVGHSYGGNIVGGVATLIPEKIRNLVYLDGFVPTEPNQAPIGRTNPERLKEIMAAAEGHHHIPPSGFERWTSDPEARAWLREMTTPQPRACFGNGVSQIVDPASLDLSRDFILCGRHDPSPFQQFYARYKDDPLWTCHVMDCLHDAMVEQPEALAALLLEIAAR